MLLRSLLPSAGIAGLVLLSSLVLAWVNAPPSLVLLVPALTAMLGGIVLIRAGQPDASPTESDALSRAAIAEARVLDLLKAAAEMRHDLRGILSPAMLTADRLALSQDPVSRRTGEAMISTIERADERLKRPDRDQPTQEMHRACLKLTPPAPIWQPEDTCEHRRRICPAGYPKKPAGHEPS